MFCGSIGVVCIKFIYFNIGELGMIFVKCYFFFCIVKFIGNDFFVDFKKCFFFYVIINLLCMMFIVSFSKVMKVFDCESV